MSEAYVFFSPESYQLLKNRLFEQGYRLYSTMMNGCYVVTRILEDQPCCYIFLDKETGLTLEPGDRSDCCEAVRQIMNGDRLGQE